MKDKRQLVGEKLMGGTRRGGRGSTLMDDSRESGGSSREGEVKVIVGFRHTPAGKNDDKLHTY